MLTETLLTTPIVIHCHGTPSGSPNCGVEAVLNSTLDNAVSTALELRNTLRHPRTLVKLYLDLYTAYHSQASAKQSTGYGHLIQRFRRTVALDGKRH